METLSQNEEMKCPNIDKKATLSPTDKSIEDVACRVAKN